MLEEFLGSELVQAAMYVSLFTFLFMLILLKGAIYMAFEAWWKKHHEGPVPEDWPLRSAAINLVTLVVAVLLVFGRYQFDWLTSLLTGTLACAFAISGYEPLKNLLGAIGIDINAINAFNFLK